MYQPWWPFCVALRAAGKMVATPEQGVVKQIQYLVARRCRQKGLQSLNCARPSAGLTFLAPTAGHDFNFLDKPLGGALSTGKV